MLEALFSFFFDPASAFYSSFIFFSLLFGSTHYTPRVGFIGIIFFAFTPVSSTFRENMPLTAQSVRLTAHSAELPGLFSVPRYISIFP